MTRAIKITSGSQVLIVDDWESDEDYGKNNVLSGYSLSLPKVWEHRKYILSVFIVDRYEDTHEYNHRAYGEVDQFIKGFMIICNEDEHQAIDFTLDDYHYLLLKLKDIFLSQENQEGVIYDIFYFYVFYQIYMDIFVL